VRGGENGLKWASPTHHLPTPNQGHLEASVGECVGVRAGLSASPDIEHQYWVTG